MEFSHLLIKLDVKSMMLYLCIHYNTMYLIKKDKISKYKVKVS